MFNFIDIGSRGVLNKRWRKYYINNILTFDPEDKDGSLTETIYSGKRIHRSVAIFDIEGPGTFYNCKKYRVSSLFQTDIDVIKETVYGNNVDPWRIVSTEEVDCVRLDTVLDELDIEFDFLKVDTQGADLAVLRSAGRYLNTFKAIEVEGNLLPIYKGAPLFDEVKKYLENNDFSLLKKIPSSGKKRLVWNDYLFINNNNLEVKGILLEIYR